MKNHLSVLIIFFISSACYSQPHSMNIDYAKLRLNIKQNDWSKWVISKDKRNSVIIDNNLKKVTVQYEDTTMNFEIMDIEDTHKKGFMYVLSGSDKIWCGLEWSFAQVPNTFTLLKKDFQICYYLKK